jgi:hypothetical protein
MSDDVMSEPAMALPLIESTTAIPPRTRPGVSFLRTLNLPFNNDLLGEGREEIGPPEAIISKPTYV